MIEAIKKGTAVERQAGSQVAKLKKLLLANDLDKVAQGVELAASLSDPVIYEALLGGVTLEHEKVVFARWVNLGPDLQIENLDVILPNALFDASSGSRVFRQHALLGLITSARGVYGDAIRCGIKMLRMSAGRKGTIDVAPIVHLPNLRKLLVSQSSRIEHIDALLDCSLECLRISEVDNESLEGLSRPLKLKELVINAHGPKPVLSGSNFEVSDCVTLVGNAFSDANFRGLNELRLYGEESVNLLVTQKVMPKRIHLNRTKASFLQTLNPFWWTHCASTRSSKTRPFQNGWY